jgi:hypothetical protein
MTFEMKFNDEYQKALKEIPIPFEITEEWKTNALNALHFASPISLGITAQEMYDLRDALKNDEELSLYQFAVLNNNMEARTANELGLCLSSYLDHQIDVSRNTTQWNEVTTPLRDGILEKIKKAQEATQLKKA